MDTSTYSSNIGNQNAQSSVQRKFYQWVLRWINGVHVNNNDSNGEESCDIRNPARPDVPTLAGFLQAIGFKLLSFEKHNDVLEKKKGEDNKARSGVLTIAIECGSSNMRAILELGDITCQCPNSDHVKDASFWSISGTGPTGSVDNIAQKVEETGSNLLPHLSKEVTRVLRDVSNRLFEIIASEPDFNRNTDTNLNISRASNASCERKPVQESLNKEMGVMRSYTQPEMRFFNSKNLPENQRRNTSSDASMNRASSPMYGSKPPLQRQKTWDIDIDSGSLDGEPRPSPPKITSSPAMVAELSNSLGQISLPGEIENPKNITEYIIGAQRNLEKAMKMLLAKKSSISTETSPNRDQDTASVKSAPPNISSVVVSPYKSIGANTSRFAKPPIKPHPLGEHSALPKMNSAKAGQTSKARRSIEPTMSKTLTRRSMQLEQGNSTPSLIRRRSFGIPSSISGSNSSLISKPMIKDPVPKVLGNIENTPKINSATESEFTNRNSNTTKTHLSMTPHQRTASPTAKLTPNGRTVSMIKPPTRISKAIPVNITSTQPTRIASGIAKKPRINISKE